MNTPAAAPRSGPGAGGCAVVDRGVMGHRGAGGARRPVRYRLERRSGPADPDRRASRRARPRRAGQPLAALHPAAAEDVSFTFPEAPHWQPAARCPGPAGRAPHGDSTSAAAGKPHPDHPARRYHQAAGPAVLRPPADPGVARLHRLLAFPFEPFPYQLAGIAFLYPRHARCWPTRWAWARRCRRSPPSACCCTPANCGTCCWSVPNRWSATGTASSRCGLRRCRWRSSKATGPPPVAMAAAADAGQDRQLRTADARPRPDHQPRSAL